MDRRIVSVASFLTILSGLYWFSISFFLAKRSLSTTSSCDEAIPLLKSIGVDTTVLQNIGDSNSAVVNSHGSNRSGCWMDRQIDSMIVLLVDALRFDFAYYNLPLSIGKRIRKRKNQDQQDSSRLVQFVADPPTVTMQRLKGLTTGGLPTFADLSANFGGATIDDDSWVQQVSDIQLYGKRGISSATPTLTAFVGDDTWEDLYPNVFNISFPYPSFNTRDLDTVDNGCLEHLPELVQRLRINATSTSDTVARPDLEVVVVHFLGVDHVGHTYGPNNKHMDEKLRQIDAALATVLESIDQSSGCHTALIFGDHGMTDDGNHGGGTVQETNAALFVHTSPACGPLSSSSSASPLSRLETSSESIWVDELFTSIHQIDLVPTISMLLGLPIPYANLGSVVPSLQPAQSIQRTTASLALNAAQVWRYLTVYSERANKLPNLSLLEDQLSLAVSQYNAALVEHQQNTLKRRSFNTTSTVGDESTDLFQQSAGLFKSFLVSALELGQQVWTRFDTTGMIGGIFILLCGILLYGWSCTTTVTSQPKSSSHRYIASGSLKQFSTFILVPENTCTVLFLLFQCCLLTFSNSYILEEQQTVMYCMTLICFCIGLRLLQYQNQSPTQSLRGRGRADGLLLSSSIKMQRRCIVAFLVPISARVHELFVSGHGLDPSLRVHVAHTTMAFISCIGILTAFRFLLYRWQILPSMYHVLLDCVAMIMLAGSWYEKRQKDVVTSDTEDDDVDAKSGLWLCGACFYLLGMGMLLLLVESIFAPSQRKSTSTSDRSTQTVAAFLAKLFIAIMAVTGPASAASLPLVLLQVVGLFTMSSPSLLSNVNDGPRSIKASLTRQQNQEKSSTTPVNTVVIATLLRLIIRHAFFATNHGCTFNRLQYSAAFVASTEFHFVFSGISLFLNTFGWEIVGLILAWIISQHPQRKSMGTTYCAMQLCEALFSCISVSLLRRHLMVWDIYAPHFVFTTIYTLLHVFAQLTILTVGFVS